MKKIFAHTPFPLQPTNYLATFSLERLNKTVASILPKDSELNFPDFTIVSASAGSGKTRTLTLKLLQLLLSDHVPNHRLQNILAMTFTKNAAAEMRQRLLEYLKKASLGDSEYLMQLSELVSMDSARLQTRCVKLIEYILNEYSAFQVQTIDSFMARVFRASALEYGFSPALEIIIDNRALLDEAFDQFARELSGDPSKRSLLEELTEVLSENQINSTQYIWNPYKKLSDKVRELYGTLSTQSRDIVIPVDNQRMLALRKEIFETFRRLHECILKSGLEMTKNFEEAAKLAASGDVEKMIKRKSLFNLPVRQSGGVKIKEKVEEYQKQFEPLQEHLHKLSAEYAVQQARNYYRPYIEALSLFRGTIEQIMRRSSRICLADVNRAIMQNISKEIVPQVYFYLGDTIAHYLIDEFQDTAPSQWEAMKPLFAETLSKDGSLFIVGDIKQSIYGFRHADWKIMKGIMTTKVFPSAPPAVKELETNYRSRERILEFNNRVFHEIVPSVMSGDAPHASGLSSFKQEANACNRHKGYVEVLSLKQDEEHLPERTALLNIINDCHARGYEYGDITILTPKNDRVITISGWLNNAHIRFISHSSLDIRGRAIIGEIIAMLRFLDLPINDLAFAIVLLGGIFKRVLAADQVSMTTEDIHSFLIQARKNGRKPPLYASFRTSFAQIWDRYFENLFTVVGYLPMYDLVSEIYKQFRLFELIPEEEAALAKLLEVIKNFEENGQNNLKDFLAYTDGEGDESDWNINVPRGTDAVSVMTVHKAKGLDNRVVIVLLIDSKPRANNLFIENTEEGARLLHITRELAAFDQSLGAIYEQYHIDKSVDELNKLYVALTRAKEEMYVISLKTDWAEAPSKYLPLTGYGTADKPVVERKERITEPSAELYHSQARIPARTIQSEKLALFERRRGEAIHDVLSHIKYEDEYLEPVLISAVRQIAGSWMEQTDAERIKELVMEFVKLPEIAPLFAQREGRNIFNEQEFVNSEGRLFRMDRVIVDIDTVTVLDFKTGDDKEGYTEQVRGYMDILKDLYSSRAICGMLAFVDRRKIRIIE